MPYTGNPGDATPAERRDYVYFRVGDTDTAHQLLTDAEVDALLLTAGDNTLIASSRAAKALGARFAKQPRVAHGPSSVDPSKIAENYFQLADELNDEYLACATVLCGGISKSDVQATESDSDRVVPSFGIGQDDYNRQRGDADFGGPNGDC